MCVCMFVCAKLVRTILVLNNYIMYSGAKCNGLHITLYNNIRFRITMVDFVITKHIPLLVLF